MFYVFVIFAIVKCQESTPSSEISRHFKQHPELRQFLEEISPEPTKKGPVLFPNDAPPPPRPPLVVTSRPLAESIARSELNNSVADSSYISPVTYRPNYRNFENNQPPQYQNQNDVSSEQDYSEAQNYAFSYVVKDKKTGDDFSHKQQSFGSATNGEYRVRLPDGRVQIVSYTADDNGYKANVRYDNEPNFNQNNENYNNFDKQNYGVAPTYDNLAPNYDNSVPKYDNLAPNYDNLAPNYDNLASKYDFKNVNYREEIPVTENDYDSKEYYDYSAENYKNPNPTVSPFTVSESPYLFQHTTPAPFQQYQTTNNQFLQYQTTPAPFLHFPTTNNQFQQYQTTPAPILHFRTTDAPLQQYQTTVRPAYNDIKHLFTTPNYNNIEVNSPSSYSSDNIVLIGAKKYDTDYQNDFVTTETPYFALNNNLNNGNTKPVLSNSFLARINKYLSFK